MTNTEFIPVTEAQKEQAKQTIAKLEEEKARIEKTAKISELLNDLVTDPRYIAVFDEFYLKDEVVRNVMLLAEKPFLEASQRQSLEDTAIAQSNFNDWVESIKGIGPTLAGELQNIEDSKKSWEEFIANGVPVQLDTPPEGE